MREAALPEADPRLLEVLTSLNQIGSAINQIGPRDDLSVEARLRSIVESATRVVPGASAVIYSFDERERRFEPASRVSAGEWVAPAPGDEPRPHGMGMRAIGQRRRTAFLSFNIPAGRRPARGSWVSDSGG